VPLLMVFRPPLHSNFSNSLALGSRSDGSDVHPFDTTIDDLVPESQLMTCNCPPSVGSGACARRWQVKSVPRLPC